MNKFPSKSLMLTCILIFLFFYGYSQIQGEVKDTLDYPVPFANVILRNAIDSSLVTGVVTTDEGVYNITDFRSGKYFLEYSAIGFTRKISDSFTIESSREHMHRETIHLETDVHELDEVSVVAQKPIFELEPDRMVVNVENSIVASGGTALEALEKSPGVLINRRDNSISLAGKGGVKVMIDGKLTRMPDEALVQMLDGMNAENVKKIELITSPPAKYDATGAGIINIVLKKREGFGTNGSFTLGAGVAHRERTEASLSLNHHAEKFNFFGNYSVNYANKNQYISNVREWEENGSHYETTSNTHQHGLSLYQNIRMGFDYTISSKTMLSLITSGYFSDWDNDATNPIVYYENGVAINQISMSTLETNKKLHGMGSLNLRHNFHEKEILDLTVDYLNYYLNNPTDMSLEYLNENQTKLIELRKETPMNFLVAAVDYSNAKNDKFKFEYGAKFSQTWFNNDVRVRFFESGNWTVDPDLTSFYKMNENILAVYISSSWNISKKTALNTGLRYEYINTVLDSNTEKGVLDLHYGELFPSFFLSQKIGKNSSLILSYRRGITRPTSDQIAPFVMFFSPEVYVAGNENLKPAISSVAEIKYQYKSYILSLGYTNTRDQISRFQPYIDDQGRQVMISRNLDRFQQTSAMLAFPVTISKWWSMQNTFFLNWSDLRSDYEGIDYHYNFSSYYIISSNNFTINDRFSADVSGSYYSKTIWGTIVNDPMGRVDIGVQWELKDERSKFRLVLSDAFKTNVIHNGLDIPELNIYNRWRLDFEPRVLTLRFTHSFGNTTVKTRSRKTASEEEQKRATN